MAEGPNARIWMGRAVFVVLALVLIFIQLLPLDMRPASWAAPDILLAITLVWVTRRPEYVPVLVIALIFMLTDLLFQRPPGLWTALVVVLTETLRKRTGSIRNIPLALEWGSVAFGVVAITVAYRAVMAVMMLHQAPITLTFIQMVMTIVIYPVVVAVAYFIFGVSRPAPGQVDSLGHRL